MDIIGRRENKVLNEDEILKFIEQDKLSQRKRFAKTGQNYYDAEHDIKKYELYYVDSDGKIKKDTTRSNIKMAHPFFTELVDQEVQYMISGENSFICSDKEELQKQLDLYFNDDFRAELEECLTGTVAKGFEYMHAYKSSNAKTQFMTADSMGVVEVRAKDTDDKCEYIIHWYTERMGKEQKEVKRIQVWDKNNVLYYIWLQNGKIELDSSVEVNPKPHIVYKKNGDDSLYYEGEGGYGFIPFFRLDNNKKQISGLKPIKDIVDDYDLIACGLSNNLQDFADAIYLVRGFQGDNLDELIENVKVKKHIGTEIDGDLDIKTVDIPYEARKIKLEIDEKNIYRFGMGFNSAQLGDGNITNIVIKSRYALLDLKCNKLEIRLKQFLRKLIDVVLAEINKESSTDYKQSDVYFKFNREVMTNAQDNAAIEKIDAETKQIEVNIVLSLQAVLGDETIIKNICDILDIDYDEVKAALPVYEEKQTELVKTQLNNIITDEGEAYEQATT